MIVVINKMDRIAYDATRFREIETEITDYLGGLGLPPSAVIPVSAREGVGITEHTYTSEWYRPTVVEALDALTPARAADRAFAASSRSRRSTNSMTGASSPAALKAAGLRSATRSWCMPSGCKARVKSIEVWPCGQAGDAYPP